MHPPNDAAISGHRLYGRGLDQVLWAGEVLDSEWTADLERRNRVHPSHQPERFSELRHFVLPLKEDTVEVVARSVLMRSARPRSRPRTLALPDAQSVEDLTALLTSAGER